jgi:hypothetical protein
MYMARISSSKQLYNYLFLFVILFLAIFIGYYVGLIKDKKEPFIPAINTLYRPHVRNIKLAVTDKINMAHKHVSLLLKKFKIM